MDSKGFLNNHLFKFLPKQIQIIGMQCPLFLWKWFITTLSYFSYILTTIVTIITFAKFFNTNIHYEEIEILGIKLGFEQLFSITATVALISALINHWPKIKASTKVKDIDVIIKCCDIFEQHGLKVIHTTDTFDMKRIKKDSVIGKFVELCSNVNFELEKAIKQNLRRVDFDKRDESLPGKKDRYKLGTICPIRVEEIDKLLKSKNFGVYCLVAFTHMKEGTVEIDIKKEYRSFLINMWKNLAISGVVEDDTVNVCVMGNKFIKEFPPSYTITQKIGIMVETFFEAARDGACCHKLTICIDNSDAANIDFSNFKNILKYVSERAELSAN